MTTLLAQMTGYATEDEKIAALRDAFRVQQSAAELTVFWWLLLIAGVGGLAAIGLRLFRERREVRLARGVDYLAIAVELLDLSATDRRLLRLIVQRAGLPHPAAVLLSPANLAHAAECAGIGPRDNELYPRLQRLRDKLFNARADERTP